MTDFYLLGMVLAAAATLAYLGMVDRGLCWVEKLFIALVAALLSWATIAVWFGVLVAAVMGIEEHLSDKGKGGWLDE